MRDAARRVPTASLVLVVLCLVTSIGPAHATSVLVPDDYATIQQAIDSGADTVVVREGRYEEDLVATGDLTLLSYEPLYYYNQFFEIVVGGLATYAGAVSTALNLLGEVDAEMRGEFDEYESDKYQDNNDIQPSLFFKELNPESEADPQMRLPFGMK